ncbi:MAG: hypothetical protein ACE1ZI_04465 [Acidobacteriota bacterium]
MGLYLPAGLAAAFCLQLYLDHLRGLIAQILTGVLFRIAPAHLPGFVVRLSGLAVRLGEFRTIVREEYAYAGRMFVHRDFFTWTYVPAEHPDILIFKLDLALVWGYCARILGHEGNCKE